MCILDQAEMALQVPKVLLLVDTEGEGLQLLRAAHSQASHGSWTELGLDTQTNVEEAFAVLRFPGNAVSLLINPLNDSTEALMQEVGRRADELSGPDKHRLIFVIKCALL